MKLVIVESPAKSKTISKYLGKDYTVKASVGHVRDLPKSNKKAIDIEDGFHPNYEIVKGKEDVIEDLKAASRKADEVLLATDPDREGEAIAWHLVEALNLEPKKTKRVVFHEITEDAVTEAIKHPRDIDENLRKAQEARRVLDRLVGYDLSGLIWKKVRYGLSAGRVQSPALRILMEREREIRAFVPEDYWVITAETTTADKHDITFTCTQEPSEEAEAERIVRVGKAGTWAIDEVKETQAKRAARAPFTTSTLQQTASSRLGFAPSRTMQIAQRLYEAGHITYMRTDSTTLAASAVASITSVVEKEHGKDYVATRQFKTTSKSAQEAHEAIRPTSAAKKTAGTTEDQKKLYALIRARALASQMADAQILRTKVTASVTPPSGEEAVPTFAVNGSRVVFDGWLAADPAARGEDVDLPKVASGDALSVRDVALEHKQTQPPARYSEASLIKELEKRGIGRPSTYASIMKTLNDRGYVEKDGRSLVPTDTGDVVSTFLENHFDKYISDTFTAEMENELDEIAAGKREYETTLEDFYTPFSKDVESKADIEKLTTLGDGPKEFPCPECGAPMVIKLGKAGTFLSCSKFPDCVGARMIDGEIMEAPKETGENCPQCEEGKLIERHGRFGKFVGCNRYPKCKYLKQDEEEQKKNSTGVPCPLCEKAGRKGGEMMERHGRFGPFYSCTNYPDCKYAIKAKPTGAKCPECGALMMDGTKTIPERCSDKACPNHRPDKLEAKK